jgi:hemolysin III
MLNAGTKPWISEYSFREELLNALTHATGAILSVVGLVILYLQADTYGTEMHMISYIIFGSSLIILYFASTLYHSLSNTKFNKLLKQIDHLAIYFLIAGTYSPLMMVGMKGSSGILILKIIWFLAIVSCIFRVSKYVVLQRIAFANYLLMGWLVLVVLDELILHIPAISLYLLFIGGVLYTSGVIFYCWEKLPFNHSIWHVFVLGGSTSHYFSVYYLLA